MAGQRPQVNVSAGRVSDQAARRQLEQIMAMMPPFMGYQATDPDTSAWGEEMEGVFWWNSTAKTFKHWSGSAVVSGL